MLYGCCSQFLRFKNLNMSMTRSEAFILQTFPFLGARFPTAFLTENMGQSQAGITGPFRISEARFLRRAV